MSDDFCVRWYHHPKHHFITTTSTPKLLTLSPSFLHSSIFIPSFGMLPGRPFWHALSSTLFASSLVDPLWRLSVLAHRFCTLRRRPSSHGPCQPFSNPPPRSTFFTHPWLTSFACFLVNPFTPKVTPLASPLVNPPRTTPSRPTSRVP